MAIGSNLKKILADKKITIKDLSVKSGIPLNTLYSITKRDSQNINSSVLTAIAQALDVSPFDITNDSEKLSTEVKIMEEVESSFGENAMQILNDFTILNEQGQEKAIGYVSDLLEQPKYQKNPEK